MQFPSINLPNGAKIPVALISLQKMPERRQKLRARAIPMEWIDNFFHATDFRTADPNVDLRLGNQAVLQARYKNRLRPADVGCAVSHRKAADAFCAVDGDLMLVLEDDIIPVNEKFLLALTDIALSYLPLARSGKAFVCHLGPHQLDFSNIAKRPVYFKNKIQTPQFLYLGYSGYVPGAYAYLLSREAAKRFSKRDDLVQGLADDWLHFRSLGISDQFYFSYPAVILPDLVNESSIKGLSIPYECNSRSPLSLYSTAELTSEISNRIIGTITRQCKVIIERAFSGYPVHLP